MQYALIFALMSGRPTVLEYRGNQSLPYDTRFAKAISLDDAEWVLLKHNPPVLLALPKGPVIRATEKEARTLFAEWQAAKGDTQRMKEALEQAGRTARTHVKKEKLLIP